MPFSLPQLFITIPAGIKHQHERALDQHQIQPPLTPLSFPRPPFLKREPLAGRWSLWYKGRPLWASEARAGCLVLHLAKRTWGKTSFQNDCVTTLMGRNYISISMVIFLFCVFIENPVSFVWFREKICIICDLLMLQQMFPCLLLLKGTKYPNILSPQYFENKFSHFIIGKNSVIVTNQFIGWKWNLLTPDRSLRILFKTYFVDVFGVLSVLLGQIWKYVVWLGL